MAFLLHFVTMPVGRDVRNRKSPSFKKAARMTCKIERLASKGNMSVLRLCGWIQVEHVKTIRELIEQETGKVALDLTEMTLVDRDVVNFLATCELKGIELRNCPAFLREWVTSEKLRIAEEPH